MSWLRMRFASRARPRSAPASEHTWIDVPIGRTTWQSLMAVQPLVRLFSPAMVPGGKFDREYMRTVLQRHAQAVSDDAVHPLTLQNDGYEVYDDYQVVITVAACLCASTSVRLYGGTIHEHMHRLSALARDFAIPIRGTATVLAALRLGDV